MKERIISHCYGLTLKDALEHYVHELTPHEEAEVLRLAEGWFPYYAFTVEGTTDVPTVCVLLHIMHYLSEELLMAGWHDGLVWFLQDSSRAKNETPPLLYSAMTKMVERLGGWVDMTETGSRAEFVLVPTYKEQGLWRVSTSQQPSHWPRRFWTSNSTAETQPWPSPTSRCTTR